jgi:hypothetical protein
MFLDAIDDLPGGHAGSLRRERCTGDGERGWPRTRDD